MILELAKFNTDIHDAYQVKVTENINSKTTEIGVESMLIEVDKMNFDIGQERVQRLQQAEMYENGLIINVQYGWNWCRIPRFDHHRVG